MERLANFWRPKDDGSERLSPFLGRRGQTTILEDADVTYDDETDGGIDGLTWRDFEVRWMKFYP